MMKTKVKIILGKLVKPSIIFESVPPFSDNTKQVFDEFVKRGYQKKYRLIWSLEWEKSAIIHHGKVCIYDPTKRETLFQKIYNYSFFFRTKCIICCNSFITSSGNGQMTFGDNQKSFYLTHGTPMKSVKTYSYMCPEGVDFFLSPSPELDEVMCNEFGVPKEKLFSLGFPRNDVFSLPPKDIIGKIGGGYNKIIVWYPTFRQHKNKKKVSHGNSVPIIHDRDNAMVLNEVAKRNNVLLIFKPHFAQDLSSIADIVFSNILMIDDSFFEKMGFSSYEMLAASDALITDYSSVYFDYTLRDKPIGVVWEDIEDYKEYPGFAVDLDYYLKGAEKIYNINQLCAFVNEVAEGVDVLQKERRFIRDIVNYADDGKNTQRVVDFIVSKANL